MELVEDRQVKLMDWMAPSSLPSATALGFFASLYSCLETWPSFSWQQIWVIWVQIRANVVAPVVKFAEVVCLIMSVMLITEKLSMGAASLFAKVFRWRPERRYKCVPMGQDLEMGSLAYPMVLVQIPMYNERQVYELSIGAVCGLSWPSDRIIVQVLDDSTDPEIKELVEQECKKWASKGINIKYEIRDNRHGYKAGALKKGLTHSYALHCDYVAIFDADFQPEADFLLRTVPFLVHNPQVALVQARWKFVNANECMMTRIQEMSMDYHFKVEQESGSTMYSFFGFNGTAGVWRISALEEAGGWKDRTTVEDMDLAVRVTLCGWKFIFVGSVKLNTYHESFLLTRVVILGMVIWALTALGSACWGEVHHSFWDGDNNYPGLIDVKSELPSTFKAYRNQQHRWACGPSNLFRKTAEEIRKSKKISLWRKIHLMYSFFVVRRIIAHIVTFTFYCVVIPTSVFIPEVKISKWGVVYIPTTITLLNSVGTPSSFHLLFFWIFFENVMSMHRTKAVLTGLLDIGKVNEWVVTEKLGNASKADKSKEPGKKSGLTISKRFLLPELGMALYLFLCACYDLVYGKNHYFFYIYPQALTFFIVSIGYVGTFVPS